MMIFMIIFSIIMLLMSLLLLSGRGAFLISGYNMMSKEAKANINEKKLCRDVGKMLLVVTLSMVLLFIGIHFKIDWLTLVGTALTIIVPLVGVVFFNKSRRYLKEGAENTAPGFRKFTKLTLAITVIVLIGVGVLMVSGFRGPTVNVSQSSIQITGIYGLTVEFSEISSITLIDSSMRNIGPGRRTNGFAGLGDALKGNFRSDANGEKLLFVRASSYPTIHIERANARDIFISFSDNNKTLRLYNEIRLVR
ncbi:MAG: DUF3784 domain-containing protein [Defluviitaleaceae bacterium]|nr:DUF3784 domain-containing protein [Defluviitaleaceae bacterium]